MTTPVAVEEPSYLEMSDADIMNMQPPQAAAPVVEEATSTPPADGTDGATTAATGTAEGDGTTAATTTATDDAGAAGGTGTTAAGAEGKADDKTGTGADGDKPAGTEADTTATKTAPVAGDKAPVADDKTKPVEAAPAAKTLAQYTVEDKAAAFDKLMAPFKANGKDIQLQTPEEALALQKMGANYTKKMQQLQPQLRIVKMLENNQLLDEGRLAHLIDLSKGNPDAIQKLLADSKFDPLTADTEKAAGYVPGNHQVSDVEIAFQSALDDIESSPTGPELIAEVAKQWDADSKRIVFQDPEILRAINEQRANGIYARISTEIDRQRVLGNLQGVPFLHAYKRVGDALHASGLIGPDAQKTAPEPVEVRTATPPAQVTNNERARAASPTRTSPASANTEINYLEESDADFIKRMEGRV